MMKFHTRKLVKTEDLKPNKTLFGGRLLERNDEKATVDSIGQVKNSHVVTKFMSEINFMASAKEGDIIEIGIEVVNFGNTSLVLQCEVRNKMTHETIITVDKITMVNLDADGKPKPHGKTQIEYVKERLANKQQ